MPHINKVRLVNVNFNDAKGMYDDFIMNLNGKSTTYDLMNTGGKSMLLLMMLQTVLPNTYLKKEKPLKNIFIGGNPKRTSHCLIEWVLDEGYQYKYMLTGFCARKKQDGSEYEENKSEDKLEIDYFNYCYFYNDINRYDIKYLPLVTRENNEKEYMSYDKLRQLLMNMKREELPVQIFDSRKEYMKNIEHYGLISAEWKLISEINVSENYIEKYFKENKTSRKLIENFLIKIIDNVNNSDEESELAQTLIELKDNLMEFRKKSDNKQEFVHTKEMYGQLEEKNKLLINEFAKTEDLDQKAYQAFVYNTQKYTELKNKIEKERMQVEELLKENILLESTNKKLEIDELYNEKEKIQKDLDELKIKKQAVEDNLNKEIKKEKLAKAQNEYVDYSKNKEDADKIQIQISNLSLGEKDLKEKYEKYGYNYKSNLKEQIENENNEYEKQKLVKKEKEEAKKIAKEQENKLRADVSKSERTIQLLKEQEDENQENIDIITQNFAEKGKIDLILNLEEGINKQNQELENTEKDINEKRAKIEELKDNEIKGRINLTELNSQLQNINDKFSLSTQEIEKYEERKNSLDKLAITFNVENAERLNSRLEEELEKEDSQRVDSQIELKEKEKKLELIQKYNMVVPNEDIFKLKEKLQDKCAYITTGIESIKELNESERDEFILKNPIFAYSVFIDDETFRKMQNNNFGIEIENVVPIISIEVLREKRNIEEKDIIFPVQRSFYKNLKSEELEKYKENLTKNIQTINEKIELCNTRQEKIRNYLMQVKSFEEEYTKENVDKLYENKENIEKELQEIENKIKEQKRTSENMKEEKEKLENILVQLENAEILLKQELDELNELKKLQTISRELKQKREAEKRDYDARKEELEEKIEIYNTIEEELENIKNKIREYETSKEKLQEEFNTLPEFSEAPKIQESFEEIKNTFKALNEKMQNSNKQFSDLQESYNKCIELMEKCKQFIVENECEIEYFSNKGQVQKVPKSVLEEYAAKVEEAQKQFSNISNLYSETEKQHEHISAKIELLKEQLLNEKGETYDENKRIQDLETIKKEKENNQLKIKLNKKQISELTRVTKEVEEKTKELDTECQLLNNFIVEKEIEKMEVNTFEILESELYSYKKVVEERKRIEKEVEKLQNRFTQFIEYIKSEVQNYYIKQDVLDTISQINLPNKLGEAKAIQEGIAEIIRNLEEKINHINDALKMLEGYQQNFITKCTEKAETIVIDLNKLPGLSRIKIGGKDVNIIKLDLFEYEKEEKRNRMKNYIYSLVEEMEKNPEKMTKEYLNECLSSKSLVSQIVNMDKAVVKLYKIEDIQENSTYKKWEDDLGSDGQVNAIYFMFAVCIISYISMLTRAGGSYKTKKVIIADNPFGATSAVFLWKVMFSILKENNVQLIAPGHNISKEIVSMFEVNYVLKHEYYNGNKKCVVVDKEFRTEDELDNMNFEVIQGDQQSMF